MEVMKNKQEWYALNVVSNQEKSAKKNIQKELDINNITDYVEHIEIPMEKVLTMTNGKKSIKEKVIMPGYILIKADLSGEVLNIIRNTKGVFGFITENLNNRGGRPSPMRKSEIDKFLDVDDDSVEKELLWSFVKNDSVKILDGPFSGFNGIIDKLEDDKKKMTVMVNIFGRETPVALEYSQVDRL